MSITSTEKKRRLIMFTLLAIAMGAVILLASLALFAPKTTSGSASVAKTRTDAVTGQAGGQGSEEYNKKLEAHDQQQANTALLAGESFIPTPVGKKSSAVTRKPDTAPPSPPVTAPRVAPAQTTRPDNSAMQKRMLEDLAALDGKLSAVSAGDGQIVFLRDFEAKPSAMPTTISSTPDHPNIPQTALKPGDLLYAVIDTGVNSDVPSAVMATVASGRFKNSRLLGSFQRMDERLVLIFSRLILPDGENVQVEAYAVDPATSESSVASSVNTHFFSRWGGLVVNRH